VSLFVDASALIAVIAGESDRMSLMETMRSSNEVLWSSVAHWEAVAGLHHGHELTISEARERVAAFGSDNRFRMVAIGEVETAIALDAYETYGKGRHPARLNMGDCFAYACTKANQARLLYKGNDFALTDLA
jgi:ribonuclease VapC